MVAPIVSAMFEEHPWVSVRPHAAASVCAEGIETAQPARMKPYDVFGRVFDPIRPTHHEDVPDETTSMEAQPYVRLLQAD